MSATPIVCVHCRQQCTARFEIMRFDRAGVAQPAVISCSISCLIIWAYEYATLGGMRIAYGAKQTIENLMNSLKGIGK